MARLLRKTSVDWSRADDARILNQDSSNTYFLIHRRDWLSNTDAAKVMQIVSRSVRRQLDKSSSGASRISRVSWKSAPACVNAPEWRFAKRQVRHLRGTSAERRALCLSHLDAQIELSDSVLRLKYRLFSLNAFIRTFERVCSTMFNDS